MTAPEITYTRETVTPDIAQKYLDRNKLNRPVKDWHVNQLANDMTNGNFVENGENGVTFDWNGNIAGGQHTLKAIVKSGKTVKFRVTRGVAPEVRATMNDSLKQSFSDDLSIAGVSSASLSDTLLRKVIVWEAVARQNKGQGGLAVWKTFRTSRAALAAEWPTYANGIVDALNGTAQWHRPWPGNRGAMQLMYWLLTEKYAFSDVVVDEFFSNICYGSSDPTNRVMFQRLREKFNKNSAAPAQMYWLVRVWNAWIGEEKLSKLQEPQGGIRDPYPRVRRPR